MRYRRIMRIRSSGVAILLSCAASLAWGAAASDRLERPAPSGAAAEQRAFDFLLGEGRPVDRAQATRWFEQAAKAGRPVSQWMLAQRYAGGDGVPKNAARAIELLRASAEQGVAGAQSLLGWVYLAGADVKPDEAQALQWLTAAAKQEDGYAMGLLAQMHGRGAGVPANAELARRLLFRAVELGDANSCRHAAMLLLYGPAEQRDAPRGMHVLAKAAELQDLHAEYLLARQYLLGKNVPRDVALAVKWLTSAYESEHWLAAMWLSELYSKGIGIARDQHRADEILGKALSAATIEAKNEFAWELSVAIDPQFRNGALAVRVLQPALAAADEKPAQYIDTLAAAYAELGRFDDAVSTQRQAIAALPRTPVDPTLRAELSKHLDLYQRGEPYREEQR